MKMPDALTNRDLDAGLQEGTPAFPRALVNAVVQKYKSASQFTISGDILFPDTLSASGRIRLIELSILMYRDWLYCPENNFFFLAPEDTELFGAFDEVGTPLFTGFIIRDQAQVQELIGKIQTLKSEIEIGKNPVFVDFIASNPYVSQMPIRAILRKMFEYLKGKGYTSLISYTGYPTTYKTYKSVGMQLLNSVANLEKHGEALRLVRGGGTLDPKKFRYYEVWDRLAHLKSSGGVSHSKIALTVPEAEYTLLFRGL